MTAPETNDNTHTVNFDADTLAPRELRVVLVCDVVESVRWMEQDEDYAVTRWQAFAHHVRGTIVPAHGGSVVKSTGDGMMVEFTNARSAVQAANALHAKAAEGNTDPNPQRHLQLRTGIHETHARRDAHDLYGHGVNLAARITTLAGPGEIIVSAPVRDHLTDSLDGVIEDMGECYLKHVSEPQRVYRIGVVSTDPILVPQQEYAEPLQPTIAVIPFEARSNSPEHFAIGELIADGVIAQLSRTPGLRVITRLSTSAFRGRNIAGEGIKKLLNANFIVCGSYVVSGDRLLINAELATSNNSHIKWSTRFYGDLGDLLQLNSYCCNQIANGVHTSIIDQEVQRALTQPIPTLQGYSLLIGSINLMHRSSTREFDRSRESLTALTERHSKNAIVRAWLGKWHVLRVVRGLSPNPKKDAQLALDETNRAQDLEPSSAYAAAIQGHALCHLSGEPQAAFKSLEHAINLNPNESIAWLYKSVWSSMWGSIEDAVFEAQKAKELSPIDPIAYYYDMVLSGAYAFAGQYEKAIESAKNSLKKNMHQAPTLRALLVAQFEAGFETDAASTLQLLLAETPNLTVTNYLSMGGGNSAARQRVATAFRALNLPE